MHCKAGEKVSVIVCKHPNPCCFSIIPSEFPNIFLHKTDFSKCTFLSSRGMKLSLCFSIAQRFTWLKYIAAHCKSPSPKQTQANCERKTLGKSERNSSIGKYKACVRNQKYFPLTRPRLRCLYSVYALISEYSESYEWSRFTLYNNGTEAKQNLYIPTQNIHVLRERRFVMLLRRYGLILEEYRLVGINGIIMFL